VRAVLAGMQRRGLSAATISQARGVLSSALRQAVEDGLIAVNPVVAVKRPRIRRRELHWPTPVELSALLEVARGTLWEIAMLLSVATGARRSEVLGLSWEDVDFNAGTVFIRRGVQRIRRSENTIGAAFTPLKTRRARRTVALPSFTVERLRQHRRDQLERRSTLGPAWRDPIDDDGQRIALVCERGDGLFLHPDAFTHAFKRFVRVAGLHPSTRLHDVRHAIATELGRRGVHSVICPQCWDTHRLRSRPPSTSTRGRRVLTRPPPRSKPRSLPRRTLAIRWHRPTSREKKMRSVSRISRSQVVGPAGREPATNGL
jgi:integrase